ncbi:MlaD family protein [Alteraurantiacibacter aquimixticola]|uniref:MCE family protein n=1 Tax=Alteraurantiacibacter aquimixticola TaxID=2489173 RepID=A0A4T3F232_9SPHN|nr:MlaD family protein [Alteraurantiacibacter aquimixticola]TIX51295.1 MCE family protein [Alteraurantiacibacter aquimixticola]
METRANHVWVGIVTLLLLAGLAVFFVWLARLGNADRKEYDIFFQQSVGGLANGSSVAFAGVPVGQVSEIELWPRDPEYVRVRIRVEDDVPILIGTTASISFSFTGVSTLNLDGARRGAPEITCETTDCPEGVPIIPTAGGAIDEILSSAPLLLERLATLTDRLTRVLDDDNQESIAGILRNTDRISAELASASPEIRATMQQLQGTLEQSTATLAAFEDTLQSADALLENDGAAISQDLRNTLQSARAAADSLETTLKNVEPMTRQLNEQTLPAAQATMQDLRRTSETLRNLTETIESEGAGSLLGSRPLPEYEP